MRFGWWMVGLLLGAGTLAAQDQPKCVFLCAPELKIEPTWTIENLGRRGRVEADGIVERTRRESVFELIFALDVPTTIPRVGLTFEAIFVPFGSTVGASLHRRVGGGPRSTEHSRQRSRD